MQFEEGGGWFFCGGGGTPVCTEQPRHERQPGCLYRTAEQPLLSPHPPVALR